MASHDGGKRIVERSRQPTCPDSGSRGQTNRQFWYKFPPAFARLDAVPTATLTGKGGRPRPVPLWPETVETLRGYLSCRHERGIDQEALFLNPQRRRLSRFGLRDIVRRYARHIARRQPRLAAKRVTPHTFRHTTAFHLLRATQDIVAVRDWLGHRDITTTSRYCQTDPETKRRALTTFRLPDRPPPQPRWKAPDVMTMLEQLTHLSRPDALCEVNVPVTNPVRAPANRNFT